MAKLKLQKIVGSAVADLQKEGVLSGFTLPEIVVEPAEDSARGDYSTNIAFQVAKYAGKTSLDAAKLIRDKLIERNAGPHELLEKIEVAGAGFINFSISKEYLQRQVGEILKKGKDFGRINIGKGLKVNIEFISANPTGPLHVGNARGGFCGDVLANVLKASGYQVTREYYVNDMGRQIYFLEKSLNPEEAPVYKSIYTEKLKQQKITDVRKAIKFIVEEIKKTIEKMGIKYDVWFFESELYKKGESKKILELLKKKELTEEKDGGIWFKSQQEFKDDKDRVLFKKTEERPEGNTYFLSEVAYLNNKFKRGFKRLIIFFGAEHHGYVPRIKAGAEALGHDPDTVQPIIVQLVRLMEGGKEVKMSKRTGIYVTLDELLDEVGKDAARFFFLVRSYGSHLNFDLDAAKQQSEKNPVFYVQYAHARICSILKKANIQNRKIKITTKNSELLSHPSELALIKQLIHFPEVVEDVAQNYQVHRLPQYATGLATAFHQFYRDCRVLGESKEITAARIQLLLAAKIILGNTLGLMGISAPEKM